MMPLENILVVEDDPRWQEIYKRWAVPTDGGCLRVARDLAETRDVLARRAFAVALIDLRLSEDDHDNIDGIHVMEAIAAFDDYTSMVLITGAASVGVMREAQLRLGALDVVEKRAIDPSRLSELIRRGLVAHAKAVSSKACAWAFLFEQAGEHDWCGQLNALLRPHTWLRAEHFFERLFQPILPVVPRRAEALIINPTGRVGYAHCWSRRIGGAVLVCFGRSRDFDGDLPALASRSEAISGESANYDIFHQYSADGSTGVVFNLPGRDRSTFAELNQTRAYTARAVAGASETGRVDDN